MKLRFISGCICLLALTTLAVAWTLFSQPIASAHISLLAPTPTPTSTNPLTTFTQNVVNPLQSIADLLAVLLIIVFGAIIAYRIIKSLFVTNLVILPPTNATGNADLDKVLTGFLQRIRESLISELTAARAVTRQFKELNPDQQSLDKSPVPQAKVDDQVSTLLKSFQDVVSGDEKIAVQLISLAFPPQGTQVSMVLHNFDGSEAQLLNVSLEVTDLRDAQDPVLYSICEPSSEKHVVPAGQSNATASAKASDPGNTSTATADTSHQQPPAPVSIETLLQGLIAAIKPSTSDKPATDGGKPDLPTLEKRLMMMQPAVARWLAIEVVRRTLVAKAGRQRDLPFYKARLYNYLGSFHLSSASLSQEKPCYLFFYKIAVDDFVQASLYANTWYLPYENLGDTYTLWAGNGTDQDSINRQRRAISYYEQALAYVQTSIPGLSDETVQVRDLITRRIHAEKAEAQLQLAQQIQGQQPTQSADLINVAKQDLKLAEDGFDATAIPMDSHLLYYLADCYGLIAGLLPDEKPTAIARARRYLVCCMARDENHPPLEPGTPDTSLFSAAIGDSQLASLSDSPSKPLRDELVKVHTVLMQGLKNDSRLKSSGKPFSDAVNEILDAVNWLHS